MSFHLKSFDFLGKINNNKNFYIFKTTSPTDSLEIISKFGKYETAPEFFKHYTNKDIKKKFKEIENLDNLYSSLLSESYTKTLKSKIDKYISSLSKIFLLSNLISKNLSILRKAIDKTKNKLTIFYKENNINKNIQKKINNYIFNLLGNTKNKIKKRRHSVLINNNINKYSKFKIEAEKLNLKERNRYSTPEIKIIDHSINDSSLNQEKTVDITNHTDENYNNSSKNFENDNIIIESETPKFHDTLRSSIIFIQQEINDKYDILNENFSKKESLNMNEDLNNRIMKKDSFYTLGRSKSKNQEDIIKRCSSKFKIRTIDEIKNVNNINNNVNTSNYTKNSCKFLLVDKINCDNNNLNFDEFRKIKEQQRKQAFSSTVLKSSNEKIMIKDLLMYINNLFKKEIINYEEKIKLKKLIISKSEELENLYKIYYTNNKDKLEVEIKKLLHN